MADVAALDALPDDALLSIITACTDVLLRHIAVPKLEAVCGLGRLCKDLRRQLYRLRPLVGVHVRSLTVAQRLRRRLMCARGPWEVVFFHRGDATAVVVEQARRGRVISIDAHGTTLAPDVASRVSSELLSDGCSLRVLDLSHVDLNGSWAATFGEAAVCSGELREMQLDGCQLRGQLPEMNLPKLHNKLKVCKVPLSRTSTTKLALCRITVQLVPKKKSSSELSHTNRAYESWLCTL